MTRTDGRPGALRRILASARPERARLAAGAGLGVGTVACGVGLMATSAYLLQAAALHPPVLSLTVAIVGVRAFGLGRAALRYAERLQTHDAALRLLARVRVAVFTALEPLAPAGLGAHRRGDLLRRLVGDVDALQDLPVRAAGPVAVAAVTSVLSVALVAAFLPAAALALAVALAAGGVAVPVLAERLGRRDGPAMASTAAALSSEVADLVRAGPELQVWGAAEPARERVADLDADLRRTRARAAGRAGLLEGMAVLCAGTATTAVLAVGVVAVPRGFDPLFLGVVALTATAAFEAVSPLPEALRVLAGLRAAATRVLAVLDQPVPGPDPAAPAPAPGATRRTGPAPTVRLDRIAVRYPGGGAPALADLSLTLTPGCRIALVGPSGAGKSTVLAALLRFVTLSAGRYTVDGADAADLAGDDVRALYALAGQDSHLFATSIRENVRMGRPGASDADVDAVLRLVHLEPWLATLPAGADTFLGDDGARSSGGQRQRVALARALLRESPYLLLDEPTAHLDEETAEALMADVLAAAGDRGLVLVTHRREGVSAMGTVVRLGDAVERTAAGVAR